jgi:hypothetical protein
MPDNNAASKPAATTTVLRMRVILRSIQIDCQIRFGVAGPHCAVDYNYDVSSKLCFFNSLIT